MRESESKYQALVDSAKDFIYSVGKDYRVLAANKAANALFGRKPGGITGKKLGDLFVPAVAARYARGIRQVFRTGKELSAENDLQPKKRGRRSIDTILTPVKDSSGRVISVLGVTRDITRLKQAEDEVRRLNKGLEKIISERTEELRSSEKKYRLLLENLQEGVWAIDAEGVTIYVNSSMARMMGYAVREMTGNNVSYFLDDNGREIFKGKLKNRRRGIREQYDLEFVRKDGTRFKGLVAATPRFDLNGRFEGAIASILDITPRKQAEDQLREKSSEQSWLLKSMMNAFVIFDSVFDARGRFVSYRFRYINDAYERITGVKLKDVAGKTVHEIWPETEPEWVKKYGSVAVSGRPMVFEMFHKPTAKFYHCNVYRPWPSKKQFCVIFDDVTIQRRHETRMAAINACFLKHGKDPARNINALVALCGELLGGDCALYSRIEGDLLCSRGLWHVPPDYDPKDKPQGHICYDVIRQESDDVHVVRRLKSSRYARTDPNVLRYGLQTYIGKLVRCEGRAAGAICVVYKKDYAPDEDDRKTMGIIAAAIGVEEERRRVQQDLVFKNTLLSAQQEASIDGILVVDGEGKIVMFNRRFAEIWGIPDKVLALRSDERALLFVLNRLADPEEFLKRVNYLYAHRKETSREEISLSDGRTLDRYSAPLFGPAGEYFGRMWNFRDITERRQALQELRESEERFRVLFEKSSTGIMLVDMETARIGYVNQAICNMFGYAAGELTSMKVNDIHPKESFAMVESEMLALICEKKRHAHSLPCLRKDGGIFYADTTCTSILIKGRKWAVGFFVDVTERKTSIEKLRENEEKYRALFEESPIGLELFDGSGNLVMFNRACLEIFGILDAGDLKTFNLFKVPNLTEERRERLKKGGALRYQAPFDMELVKANKLYRTSRSGIIWLDVLMVPIKTQAGGFLVQVQDISGLKLEQQKQEQANRQLKDALEQLKRTEAQIIRSERLGALGQMASGISHEFNNVLVPIVGYADFLLGSPDKLDNREETIKMLRMILSAAMDARSIIRRLQDFVRPREDDAAEMVSLPDLVENVVMLLRPRWKEEMGIRGATVSIKTAFNDMVPVSCVQAQIKEVLTNLIINALDAMPGGGTIAIRGSYVKAENAVEIQVADSGHGMNTEVQKRIFEPFFTTKGGERSGLGLAITHGIISAHKGAIRYESAPDRGTTVTIRLPMGQPGARAHEEEAETAPAPKPFRILFIDDDEAVRLLIAEFLKADGHTVELASEGHEGLAKAVEGRFDLAITDSAMPGMSGSELAAAIKTIRDDLPIIMLTGIGDIMNDKKEKPAGVDMVLSKPVTRNSFRKAIAALMAGRE